MAGYTRQSSFADGDTISASLFNNEYNQLLAAFNNSTGHKHDGTADEGPVIGLIGDAGVTTPLNKILIDTTNDEIEFYIDISGISTLQFKLIDGAFVPATDNDIDLGTSSSEFKDLYIDGVAYLDSIAMPTTTVTDILDEDTMSSDSATALATQQSIKAYVDSQVTAQDLDFQADTGGVLSIDLDSETFTLTGGTGIDTSGSGNAVTFAIDSTVTTLTGTQTLTNKTLTTPVISSISNTGTLTLPTSTDTLVGRATTDTLTNKTIDVDNNTVSNIEVDNFKASAIVLESEGIGSNDNDTSLPTSAAVKDYVDTQITAEDLDFQADTGGALSIDLDSETLTFTGGTGIDTSGSGNAVTFAIDSTVATLTGTQTLTNKTLTTPTISSIVNTGTLTLPTSTDTLVGRATTDTLTNKTLTSPVLNGSLSGTAFLDEDTMSSDSATAVASQQSIKAYVDSQVATANELSELTDVNITSAADGALLFYDTGTSKWIDNVVSGDITIADTGVAAISSGVIVNADVNASAAIDATKIHDGSVTNTEFGYIGGLTSDAQTQLNAKLENVVEDTTPQLGGDLDLNSSDITGTGNLNITGTITSSGDITTSGVLNSIAPTRHSVRPSLNLDFANSKVLDPRITFTRASNATYYDGYTSVKAEENLVTYSQEFDNTAWTKTRSTITANDTTAPDGTSTAERLAQATGQTVIPTIIQYKSVVSGNDYTISCYGKAGDRNYLVLREQIVDGTVKNTFFNLSTGAVGTTNTNHTAIITDVGNSWYRCSITVTAGSTNSSREIHIANATTDGSTNNADDNGYIYIWGAQFEQRSLVTAYTPTTSSPITKYQPALQTAGNNVARFDHNPTTGESLGLLIEESRTNLQVYSEEFDNGAWSKVRTDITPNTIVAPDGTLTGDKLIANTTTNSHGVQNNFNATTGTTYVYSIYAKQAEETEFTLNFAVVELASFNLANGTTTLGSGSVNTVPQSSSITDVGNGWYRCSVVWYRAGATLTGSYQVYLRNYSTYAGDGYSGIYIWGAQIEQASFPTSYIKTTGSQVTRSVDSAVMNNIDTSDWFNESEGTIFANIIGAENATNASAGGQAIFCIHDGSTSNLIRLRKSSSSTNIGFLKRIGGTNTTSPSSTGASAGDEGKVVAKFTTTTASITADGALVSSATGNSPQGLTTAFIGNSTFSGDEYRGLIKKISFYPKALTDNEIQDLTEE